MIRRTLVPLRRHPLLSLAVFSGVVLLVASVVGTGHGQSPSAPRTTRAAAALASQPARAASAEAKPLLVTPPAHASATAGLPLKRVVLFSSGVGFFEHKGPVTGNADVELKFSVQDINDLLKSMVVQDLGGGQISTVSYGSKDPISKTLKSFAVDLTTNPTLSDLLGQMRGERVELEAPNKITGVILGVEKHKEKIAQDEVREIDVLNLLTEQGLKAVKLETVGSIKLLSEKLDSELRKALALLASSHDTDKKTVTLQFRGEGQRQARVGYLQETPVWKTSYRLLLDEDKPPMLQGWAIVENTTENDWSGVDLSLVSGRPISFTMDLYQPLYVPRPVVEMELYASLRPQSYEQDLARREGEFRKRAEVAEAKAAAAPGAPVFAGAPMQDRAAALSYRGNRQRTLVEEKAKQDGGWAMQQQAQSVATAADVGSLFRYSIAAPVDLPRQQSAMLPIVNDEVQAEKVSIYNQGVHPKHPLCGLKLTNTTKLHLMQGPITVLDEGVYAGDAKIDDLPPDGQRLISYAMDLDTEVAPESKSSPDQILKVRLLKGNLLVDRKFAKTEQYTVKNSGKKAKRVLIEYPLDPNWKLVAPKEPAEKTRDKYRFAVEAKPGEPAVLKIEEERTEGQQVGLSNVDDNTIRFYLSASVVSDRVKAALGEVVQRKQAMAELVRKRQEMERRIQTINEDQARIRQNMAQLDRTSDIYKTYVKKFSDQEQEIEKLRGQTSELAGQEAQLRQSLDEYLAGLDLQ